MGRTTDPQKKELAYLLYMASEMQKDICERVGCAAKTLQNWIDKEGWKEKRAAKSVTKTELVNKTLKAIGDLLDKASGDKENGMNGVADQLSKMATVIEKLGKKSNVVDSMDVFMLFNRWLQTRVQFDKALSLDLVKTINNYQDTYINERLSLDGNE
jgi:hypothetical protein